MVDLEGRVLTSSSLGSLHQWFASGAPDTGGRGRGARRLSLVRRWQPWTPPPERGPGTRGNGAAEREPPEWGLQQQSQRQGHSSGSNLPGLERARHGWHRWCPLVPQWLLVAVAVRSRTPTGPPAQPALCREVCRGLTRAKAAGRSC